MIEIVALTLLSTYIFRMTRRSGLSPWKYVIITILLWAGFELLGAFLGVMATGDRLQAYPFALIGSVIGGYIGYMVAKHATEQTQD